MKIEGKTVGSFEITKYEFQVIEGNPKIVISMVKVLSDTGEYIKFAKLKDVMPYLSKYPARFK
jgi:hypothetical protein